MRDWKGHHVHGSVIWCEIFALTKNNEIQHDDLCLDAAPRGGVAEVVMYKCHGKHGNQEWIYKEADKTIIHGPSGYCLDVPPQGKDAPVVARCSGHSSQQWELVAKDLM